MKKILAALLVSAGLAAPAYADFVVTGGSTLPIINNEFVAVLDAHGLTSFRNSLGGLSVNSSGTVTFYAFANESSLFTAFQRDGVTKASENNGVGVFYFSGAPADHFPGTQVDLINVLAGNTFGNGLTFDLDFIVTGGGAGGINASIGDPGFGVFYNPNDLSTIALAFDDAQPTDDDNHDDLIIIAQFTSAVPETGTWALMILGFAGLAFARRRLAKAA